MDVVPCGKAGPFTPPRPMPSGVTQLLLALGNGDTADMERPFFTTKPTGASTGLGLSLSYDIVTQGHGGALNVAPSESGAAAFVVYLPEKAAPIARS